MEASPSQYSVYSSVQRYDAKKVLDEYAEKIKWRNDGNDTVLDIGCGTGDVTVEHILSHIPAKFRKLVGVDISQEMIGYAKRTHERKNISFEVLDIEGDEDDIQRFLVKHPERFDHVMSFYCLHWVPNQVKAMKNIYNLLKPNGDCLLALLVKHSIFDIYKELSKTKWKNLMSSPDDFFADYHGRENPAATIVEMLTATGFKNHEVKIYPGKMKFTGYNEIKANVTIINPIWRKMNTEEQREYLKDYLNVAARLGVYKEASNENESTFSFSYHLLVVYTVK